MKPEPLTDPGPDFGRWTPHGPPELAFREVGSSPPIHVPDQAIDRLGVEKSGAQGLDPQRKCRITDEACS